MEFVFLGLVFLAVPFILPITGWIATRRVRRRVAALEKVVLEQSSAIDKLQGDLLQLWQSGVRAPAAATDTTVAPAGPGPVSEPGPEPFAAPTPVPSAET